MKYARKDYQDLKALDLKIPENEPVFLLRGQDLTAADVVRYWAFLQRDSYLKEIALSHAKTMDNWPVKKWADCPECEFPEEFAMSLFKESSQEDELEKTLESLTEFDDLEIEEKQLKGIEEDSLEELEPNKDEEF
jgi:hypothetical protein